MINCDDIETICLLRFGNKSKANMQAVLIFLNLHGEALQDSARKISIGICRSFK